MEQVNDGSNPDMDFTELNDLACITSGAKIIFATDDWFAVAENLLNASEPEWREGVFTEHGKWMDGWESRRRRQAGHDWCIIQLGVPGVIHGVDIDTCHFTGNNVPKASIQAACLEKDIPARKCKPGTAATTAQFEKVAKLQSEDWEEIVPPQRLQPGYPEQRHNLFAVKNNKRWTHLRLNTFPDGGIARLRVYGVASPDWSQVPLDKEVDLVSMKNGGVCTGFSDAHYGHARNLIAPGHSRRMDEGWETARRSDRPEVLQVDEKGVLQVPGFEWAAFRLGHVGIVTKIEIATHHFKGNYADSCTVEGCLLSETSTQAVAEAPWRTLLTAKKLHAHSSFRFTGRQLQALGPINHVRIVIRPDGGISRLRVWGFIQPSAKL